MRHKENQRDKTPLFLASIRKTGFYHSSVYVVGGGRGGLCEDVHGGWGESSETMKRALEDPVPLENHAEIL